MSRQGAKEQVRQLEEDLARCKTNCRNHWAGKVVTQVGRMGLAAVIMCGGYMMIGELAGKTTKADIQVNSTVSANGTISSGVKVKESTALVTKPAEIVPGWLNLMGLSVGAGGLLFGLYQARLRRDYIQLYSPLLAEKEKRKDPARSSSNITARGMTRQEDV